jgi:hypothetical protein
MANMAARFGLGSSSMGQKKVLPDRPVISPGPAAEAACADVI